MAEPAQGASQRSARLVQVATVPDVPALVCSFALNFPTLPLTSATNAPVVATKLPSCAPQETPAGLRSTREVLSRRRSLGHREESQCEAPPPR